MNSATPIPTWVAEVAAELPALSTIDEVAGLARCHRRTVTRAIARGQIRAVQIGGRGTRIPRASVAEWLARGAL